MKKVLVAMSGGVDSSTAALLLHEQGYTCVGCTMRLFENTDAGISPERSCCSLEDALAARAAAVRLGMPYYVFNFTDDFRKTVIDKFVRCYENGITPNPCIDCNRYMKFGKLFSRADALGCDYIATGHYAQIERSSEGFVLKRAADSSKDQSYVLYGMNQEQLSRTLFPLGGMQKTQTRLTAARAGLENAGKPDSQDICFVPGGDYAAVVAHYSGKTPCPGDFCDINGKVLGTHRGIIHYTVGQRRGIGLALGEPHYVCAVSAKENRVYLGTAKYLLCGGLFAGEFNWISGKAPESRFFCTVQTRYHQPEQEALVEPLSDGGVKISFSKPQRAPSPGQAAVLYSGDTVIGGGVILSSFK